jgi:LPXTG-motif cell wall-anchored protein
MKTISIVIFTIDLLKTLYTGLTTISQEKVTELEESKKKQDNQPDVNWIPYMGIGMMVIGGALLVLGRKKPSTT